jgi:hypothetical protein
MNIFTMAKIWKKPGFPTANEWIKKTMECYSGIKKNEIMLFAGKWMGLGNFMLSEVTQAQKTKGHMFFSHMCKLDL